MTVFINSAGGGMGAIYLIAHEILLKLHFFKPFPEK